MSLINLPERFLYDRLPQGLIELDERTIIWAVTSGYQDRIEDLRAYAKKFQSFFSPYVLPERGSNIVYAELQSLAGKTYTRSLDISADTPPDGTAALTTWVAAQLNVEAASLSNVRYGVDLLRLVDANILDYLATNLGAVLYKSGVNENLPSLINQSGTFTGEQMAQQRLIETYFPRLKIKGTAKSFEALAKLMGFDDLRMVPLWQRVSFRLPSDPGSAVNDPDFSQVPEYYPRQQFGPFYDPLVQDDGPFYAWQGTAAPGTADTGFYTQVVNGFQPYVKVTVIGTANGTGAIEHPATGTYPLAGGGPHQKASVSAAPLYFQALGEGASWNDINVAVYTVAAGTLRGIGISDRLSAIKYRSSYFDLTLAIDPDRADAAFGTLVARRNTDLAVAPHQYQSFVDTLTAVSPYRPFLGGTLTVSQTPFDFMAPFSGTVVSFAERTEAGLTDYQINFTEISKAAAQVTQALEEVRAATRFPRKTSVGWLLQDQVAYAPYVSHALIGSISAGSVTAQFTGSFSQFPLPPYTADVEFFNGTTTTDLAAERRAVSPERLFYRTVNQGTMAGQIIFTGSGSNHYDFLATGTLASAGTLSARFTVTSSEVVRPDAWVTSYGTGTWTYGVIGDYGLDITGVHENQRPTAAMVHSWNPVAIFTTGDNNYYSGLASEIHRNNFSYWEDIRLGRFFPTLGNHDFTGGTDPSVGITYFFNGTVPGNGRYYSVRRGNVEWFCLDPGWSGGQVSAAINNPYYTPTNEPDGNSYDSIQGQWLKRKLKESTARWKIVYAHFNPYTSASVVNSYYPGYPRIRWPFKEWGADLYLCGHVHAYERVMVDAFTYITIGCSGESNRAYSAGNVIPGSQYRYGITGLDGYGALRVQATDDWLKVDFITTADGAIRDTFRIDYPRKYQARPEDDIADLIYETADDYPWRRDLVGGGEQVETDYYTSGTNVQEFTLLEQTTAVTDQTGAQYNVYVSAGTTGPRFQVEARPTDPYRPAQRAIAFKGSFRDQAQLGEDDTQLVYNPDDASNQRTSRSRTDLDTVFNPGYSLYHAGLVQGVLVADPVGFNGLHHRQDLVGWLPFNEHPLDASAVNDRALSLDTQVLFGIAWDDRKLDAQLGRYLEFRPGTALVASAERAATDDLTISFWIKCNPGAAAFSSAAVLWGGVRFDLDFTALTIASKVTDITTAVQTVASASAADWVFVYLRKTATTATFGSASLSTFGAETVLAVLGRANNTNDPIWITSDVDAQGFVLRDLRVWKRCKTQAELRKVWNHAPVPTLVQYRIGHVLSANTGDRYGLRVLPTGWLIPENMPAWVRTPKYARVSRYDGRGEYHGESRFKEVGLGGGQVPPYTYTLGQVGYGLTAAGTTVVSTQHGAMPGTNAWWGKDATGAPGYYIALTGGSIASGSIAVSTASGSGAVPWPNKMEATNPFRDRIWLTGDDGLVYEVSLQASGIGGVTWTAKQAEFVGTVQQESGAIVGLAEGPVCIGVTTYGSFYQTTCAGTGTTPSLYLYLHDNLLENVGGAEALVRWTDPSTFGLQQGVPALADAGELAFTNSAALVAGTYKLLIDGGNIGKVDDEFDGYRLDITVGDTTFQRTFLAGYKGSNFRGQQEFEFELENAVSGEWLLLLSWSNSASDRLRGTARQLAIYGYQLRRLQTSLWQGTIAAFGTTPGLNPLPISGQWTTTPGGWLAEYNSFGTVSTWAHEGTIYPRNDTLTSRYPLANLLTGVTADRREDVLVALTPSGGSLGAFFNLPDGADPVIAAFGTDTAVGS